ncbi:uncharacterized protein LOC110822715, partial [Carica papaya]|uniref:uncharacterized protein LOC110822715 n=1 Tax=Carica papaya TaxID=3649 RepID=UPI000B8D154D
MAEASRGRVTITLGRSGQVVKKAGSELHGDFSDSILGAGSKRSLRERLGSNFDSSLQQGRETNNKRSRADSGLSGAGVDDFRISKDDLRFKLMQKNIRRAQSNNDQKGMDLREKLSRMGQAPARFVDTRKQLPMSKDTGILGRIPPTRRAD